MMDSLFTIEFFSVLFIVIVRKSEQISEVSCSFDSNSYCGWSSIVHGSNNLVDQLKWKLRKGASSITTFRPKSDFSGSGFYIYIDNSERFFYDEKAILMSPEIKRPSVLSFYYDMYGAQVESLNVIVRNSSNNEDEIEWSQSGNHGNAWRSSGCLRINLNGTYRILLEAVASAGTNGSIAVDEIRLFDNLTECGNPVNSTPTLLNTSGNCTFQGSFCGWRDLSSKLKNGLPWAMQNETRNENDSDVQGNSYYISTAVPDKLGKKKAYLVSPRMYIPYCMNFLYKISNDSSKLQVVLFRQSKPVMLHIAWECTGCGNGSYHTGRVSLTYSGEYQALIIATPTATMKNGIDLKHILLIPGHCVNEDSNAKGHGDCDFEEKPLSNGWCLWKNEMGRDVFDWTRASGSTPSVNTGPTMLSGILFHNSASSRPKEGDVRLVYGDYNYGGRIEIFHSGEWGTVCDDSWNANNARVVCRQLGFPGVSSITYPNLNPGQGRIWMDEVRCKGDEMNISMCPFNGWGIHNCEHHEDIGVVCVNNKNNTQKALEGDIRLWEKTTPTTGFLQVFHQNRWGFVCDDYWGAPDTSVACRQLGYLYGGKAVTQIPELQYAFFWMDDVACNGQESRLAECRFSGWGNNNCKPSESVAIQCYGWIFHDVVTTYGTFLYTETSSPRAPGDKARIVSPWMSGDQCMTFDYHMYGATMSCVVIYLRDEGSSNLEPIWLKSGDLGNIWHKAKVNVKRKNNKRMYQLVIEGTRGLGWQGDASLDNITFSKESCISFNGTVKMYYISFRNNVYKVGSHRMLQMNGWSDVMEIQLDLTTNTSVGNAQYFYRSSTASHSILSSRLEIQPQNFPLEIVYPSNNNKKTIYTISTNSPWKQEFRLNSNVDKKCCKVDVTSFKAQRVVRYDQEPAVCGPGWYRIGSSCYLIVLEEKDEIDWYNARLRCHKRESSELATFDSFETQKKLAAIVVKFKKHNLKLYTGFQGKIHWQWMNGDEMLSDFWGPGEPSSAGQENCGVLLNANSWDKRWHGWLWNDQSCDNTKNFICEEITTLINPVGLYPMNNVSGLNETSPKPLQSGIPHNVKLQTGPFDQRYGSYYFNGSSDSFVVLPNNGGLDTRYAITILAWIYPENPGCIFCYQSGLGVLISSSWKLTARFAFKQVQKQELIVSKSSVPSSWCYIAMSYSYKTGVAKIWINNGTVGSRNVGAKRQILTESNIRLGSAFKDGLGFRGRIAGVQVYDVALSDEEIKNFSRRSIESEPIRCSSGFIPVRGKCFYISKTKVKGTDSKNACKKLNARLAVVDREYVKKELWSRLYRLIPKVLYFFIGFEPIVLWSDNKSNLIDNNMWEPGYPKMDANPIKHAVLLTSLSKLMTYSNPKQKVDGAVCQKDKLSIAHQCITSSSSTLPDSNSSYAVDGILSNCFRSKQEDNPFLVVNLRKEKYIHKVVVTKNKDCCTSPYSSVEVRTLTTDRETVHSQCGSLMPYGVDEVMEFTCKPPVKTKQLVITSKSRNTSLVVCELEVYPVVEVHGVLREVWYGAKRDRVILKDNSVFNKKPQTSHVVESMKSPRDIAEQYAQRLTAFLQIPIAGNYTFYITCDDYCEVWYNSIPEKHISFIPAEEKKLLAKTDKSTGHNEWQKYPSQTSAPVPLQPCFLYQLQVFMFEETANDHITVAMKHPNEDVVERPIKAERLYRMMTGERLFGILIGSNQTVTANVGANIIIDGHYWYCCDGIYCPDCPLQVLLIINNNVTVLSKSFTMSCKKIAFTVLLADKLLPGDYPVKVSYDFVNANLLNARKNIGTLKIKAVLLQECNFTRGLCMWLTNDIMPNQTWDTAKKPRPIADKGYYSSVNGPGTFVLASDFLPWKPFHSRTGLCLEFHYHMSTKSLATLSIFIATTDGEQMIWNLTGYHGNGWNKGSVTWDGRRKSKVYIQGRGVSNGTVNIAITYIKITTQSCAILPTYATPGYGCKNNEFQCANKRCISKNFRCDGDEHCQDGSDENGCVCPSSKFVCPASGRCISPAALCDDQKDCDDAVDEMNCGFECKDKFQCAAGTCIEWSSTCSKEQLCPGGCHNPTICGNGSCPLNDIGCASKPNKTKTSQKMLELCRTFTVPCSFENGLCGLEYDRQSDFLWSIKSGSTPTAGTGPKFDHTTLSSKGQYIFIEASDQRAGEKAKVMSGWLNANETLCLQFWYHMFGSDIGSLAVILKTNQSEHLVWKKKGNQGNKWMFAQTTLKNKEKYKFIFEGTMTGGQAGDIALDDITLFDGACQAVYSQTSPECYFESDTCGWQTDKDWTIHTDQFKEHKGYFLKLMSKEHVQKNVSLEINTAMYEWKCLQFWYFLGQSKPSSFSGTSLHVWTNSSKNIGRLISLKSITQSWSFAQLQIPDERNLKVIFLGNITNRSSNYILLDDISFTEMKCLYISTNNDSFQDGGNCTCSQEWCCWTTKYNRYANSTWLLMSQDEINKYQERHNINSTFSESSNALDFEMALNSNSSYNVSAFSVLGSFTLCFWLKTSKPGFSVHYQFQTKSDILTGIWITLQADSINMTVMETTALMSGNLSHLYQGDWHFYCFVWSEYSNMSSIYIDGKEKPRTTYNMQPNDISDEKFLTFGYNLGQQTKAIMVGTLGDFNIWGYDISSDEIKRMSYGCGKIEGNVLSWKVFVKENNYTEIRRPATCKYARGKVLALIGLSSSSLLSPVYLKSTTHTHRCFKFRYMLQGPGAQSLEVRLSATNQTTKLIWVDKDKTNTGWRYGQVPVTALNSIQVLFEGHVGEKPGYIVLGSSYMEEATCDHQPKHAKEAFNQNISTGPGFISSPYYPGYYVRNIECTWQITAPVDHVIRLTFKDFVTEDHATCSADYVEVYDGNRIAENKLGRYCGFVYPQFLETSSNLMTVIFHSDGEKERRGFNAYYIFLEGTRSKCSRQRGCPSGCQCAVINIPGIGGMKTGLVVEGQYLHGIPKYLPEATAAVMFQGNRISKIQENTFADLTNLLYVDISNNIIFNIENNAFANMTSTETIRMSSNFVRGLPTQVFKHLESLKVLDLGKNLLGKLDEDTFKGMESLNVLSLRHNQIRVISSTLFCDLRNLTHLYLQDNRISSLPDGVFQYLDQLHLINLGNNKIRTLTKKSFQGLENLNNLNLSNNKLSYVSPDAFDNLQSLKYLKLDEFIYCCYAKKAITGLHCESPANGFSSCDDLMKNEALRVCIWILGLMAFFGNLFVIGWRMFSKNRDSPVHTLLLTNLAVADFLMGVYLLIIAVRDVQWKGEYFKHDITWRSGTGCQITGMISMLSSEASVIFLTIVTADRLICIVFPFTFKRLTRRKVLWMCACVWLFGLVISIIPISGTKYFKNEKADFGFYGRSSVCLPMQLSLDRPAGWEYSVVFFIGINFAAFTFMIVAYTAIFVRVRQSSRAVRSTAMNRESSLAKKVICIILTDFACWMPVIVIGILSLTESFHDPSHQVYVWIAVFVLPVNSSINPFLYTFSDLSICKRIKYVSGSGLASNASGHRQILAYESKNTNIDDVVEKPKKKDLEMMKLKNGASRQSNSVIERLRIILVEKPNILKYDKFDGMGYVVAMVEMRGSPNLNLIKYFSPLTREEWAKEVGIVSEIAKEIDEGEHPNILTYRWHSSDCNHEVDQTKVKVPRMREKSLICYNFVSSTSLQDFVESERSLTFRTVCCLAIDVISGISCLESCGICTNEVNPMSILVGPSKTPNTSMRAVLANFSNATKLKVNEDGCCYNQDIKQFGELMQFLLDYCGEYYQYPEITDVFHLCYQELKCESLASLIKKRLLDALAASEESWDTHL